jgi:hypothetical protein
MRGSRLAQAVYGKCSLVLPSRCNLSIVCLTLVRTIAVVALTRPPCHRLPRSPKSSHFDRSRERRVRAMASRTQSCPRSGETVPWGFSPADAWKMASRYTWGSCDRTTTGHFCLSLPQVRLLMLLLIVVNRRTRASARCSFTQRVELLPREVLQQLMKNAIVMAHGIDPQLVSGSFPNNPGPVESMPCAMYSKNVPDSRAAMPSIVVELTYDRKGSAKAWCGSLAAGSAFIAKASLAAGA